ncbi:MAG: hypothetical protein NUV69_01570 [Candidatus Curtissbacteria bacterium]|nr:hypothetical protein [Candidatus Curtissbacteria bacterium]
MQKTAKLSTFLIILAVIAGGIFWLWQRQPKANREQIKSEVKTNLGIENKKEGFDVTPSDQTVLSSPTATFKGKTNPNNYVLIYSNYFQEVVVADKDGNFEKEAKLQDGLNLVNILSLASSLKVDDQNSQKASLTFFVLKDSKGDSVFAGPVKTIFDSLVTITTQAGDQNVRTSTSTEFTMPQAEDEEEESKEPVKNIRVGDYAVAVGEETESDSIVAKKFEVIRDNKPQVTKAYATGVILTPVRQNLFSLKNNQDGKLIEFTLTKDSKITLGGQTAKSADIAKDKTAIIFFTTSSDKNNVALIHIL